MRGLLHGMADELFQVRAADEEEIEHLAKVWHDAWYDAHVQILPEALIRVRTLESFYEKHGWRSVGTMTHHLETSVGEFALEVWRYEKRLGVQAP